MSEERKQMTAEGLEILGRGTTSTVYALDGERVLKVFIPERDRDKIDREWEITCRMASLGIPCAKALERVRVGGQEGIIFERAYSRPLGDVLFAALKADDREALDRWTDYYADFAHRLHRLTVPAGTLPDIRDTFRGRVERTAAKGYLDEAVADRLKAFIGSFPDTDHYLHGDLNPFNVPLPGADERLIDVGEASVGDPAFEFTFLTDGPALIERIHPGFMLARHGVSNEQILTMEELILKKYYAGCGAEELREIRKRADLLGAVFGASQEMGELTDEQRKLLRGALNRIFTEYLDEL